MIAPRTARRHAWGRAGVPALAALGVVATSFLGAFVGLVVLGTVHAAVGPLDTTMTVRPSLTGDTRVHVAPLGSLSMDTHDGPFRVDVSIDQLDEAKARAIVADPTTLTALEAELPEQIRSALIRLAVQATAGALLGALLAGILVYRRPRRVVLTTATAALFVLGGAGIGIGTWRAEAVAEPRYSGLLASAPSVVGDAQSIVGNFDKYRAQLAKVVTNVSRLYSVATTLPLYDASGTTRVLHVSDIHLNLAAFDVIRSLVEQFHIDVVIDTGDLTDHGSAPEAEIAAQIARIPVPYVFIRGNHDALRIQEAVAAVPNAVVLDNRVANVAGITFAGIGDPRFTPDKTTRVSGRDVSVTDSGRRLAVTVRAAGGAAIALVHDPDAAAPLAGVVPLVLAGHVHHREEKALGDTTTLLVQGSTGGAGLRGLEGEKPTPLECSILYLDATTGALQARDDVTLGGIGRTSVEIARHLAKEPPSGSSPGSEPSSGPSLGPSGSPSFGPTLAPLASPSSGPSSPPSGPTLVPSLAPAPSP